MGNLKQTKTVFLLTSSPRNPKQQIVTRAETDKGKSSSLCPNCVKKKKGKSPNFFYVDHEYGKSCPQKSTWYRIHDQLRQEY